MLVQRKFNTNGVKTDPKHQRHYWPNKISKQQQVAFMIFGVAQTKLTLLTQTLLMMENPFALSDLHYCVWILEHACLWAECGHRTWSMK